MDTKLIIVDGHSSVGKSSISKSIYQQLSLHRPTYWLHEECEAHPIRQDEFSFGALETAEGMQANRAGMLRKWAAFKESIIASGKVCVTEGCLLHAYDRYFIHSIWEDNEIAAFYAQVVEVIRELDPVIVFLHRPDLRASLEKAFTARGAWWRDLMLKRDDRHVYFKNHVYVDESSMFDAISFEQKRMMEIFDGLPYARIKIDTSAEQWEAYAREILAFMGVPYRKIEPYPCDLRAYAGTYRQQDGTGESQWVISYDDAHDCLYTILFWPYMPMRCAAEGVFELISFPVQLRFQKSQGVMQFTVHGNYDWEYNEQRFVRV